MRRNLEVHLCRFVDYVPAAIISIAITPPSTKTLVAIGRANGTIEIRNPREHWLLEKTIPGGENRSLSCVVWGHQKILSDPELYDEGPERAQAFRKLVAMPPRLISSSLNGFITEWDTDTLRPKRVVSTNGGGVWCMAISRDSTKLVVGCEDGTIRLYDLTDDEFTFERAFDKQKERILSIDWHPDQNQVVSGSAESGIRLWSVSDGRVIHHMSPGKGKIKQSMVWTIKFLPDGTIVSGSNMGNIEFWDAKTATRFCTLKVHEADVSCLAISGNGKTIFSGSVDRKIAQLQLIRGQMTEWVCTGGRRYHNHDIKALCIVDQRGLNSLLSGSVDTDFNVVDLNQSFNSAIQQRILAFHARPISYSRSNRLMLCQFDRSLKLYNFGVTSTSTDTSNTMVIYKRNNITGRNEIPLQEGYQSLLEMRLQTVNNLTASHICENGKWIAASDLESVKLWRLNLIDDGQAKVNKVPLEDLVPPAHLLHFTPDGERLVVVGINSIIYVVDLRHWQTLSFTVISQFGQHAGLSINNLTHESVKLAREPLSIVKNVNISPDSRFLITTDLLSRVFVFDLHTLEHYKTLPKFEFTVTSASLFQQYAVITLSNNDFYIYESPSFTVYEWTVTNLPRLPPRYYKMVDMILGCDLMSDTDLMFWSSNWLLFINISSNLPDAGKRKKYLKDSEEETTKEEPKEESKADLDVDSETDGVVMKRPMIQNRKFNKLRSRLRFVHKYQALMCAGMLGTGQMFVVERPWFDIIQSLPPAFMRKVYGI